MDGPRLSPVWTVTTPEPRGYRDEAAYYQSRLDAFAGKEGSLSRLRLKWFGDLKVRIDGQWIAQYCLDACTTRDVKVVRETKPALDADGTPKMKAVTGDDGEPVLDAAGAPTFEPVMDTDEWELPTDERTWEPQYERLKALPCGVKTYVVIMAVPAYGIQQLVPRIHAEVGRNDDEYLVADGLYQLFSYLTEDGTPNGPWRPVSERDIEEVKQAWDLRLSAMPHRPDEKTPDWLASQNFRARVQAHVAAKRARDAEKAVEANDRFRTIMRPAIISIPGLVARTKKANF